ncbi:MAG: pyruvate kinase [Vicinamibacterales bacterium]|nr:pyruvate kinase [Vicinamibacterales bacterium]
MPGPRLTRIIATLGPASSTQEVIDDLVAAGADLFRLNFSHGDLAGHAERIAQVRRASEKAGRPVGILQDLSGPKIRTGRLADKRPIPLEPGGRLVIAAGDFVGGPGRVSTSYAPLVASVRPGDRLLLDDGFIELLVESCDGREMTTRVVSGGALGERKGINAPGVRLPASSLTDKDVADLEFGLAHGVDAVALSFVQTGEDVRRARAVAARHGGADVPIIAKIERPEAVAHVDEVLDAADGVMVARGDLGLELPLEQVPRAQKSITRAAQARGLPVIVATQVFDSMRVELRPTRAEVSDAANAVDDLVDAIMLSGETAVGAHPARTVRTLDAVIRDAEAIAPRLAVTVDAQVAGVAHSRALCDAAVALADEGHAAVIVAVTRQGRTARMLSAVRPPQPLVAVVSDDRLARRLLLHRGVTPVVVSDAVLAGPRGEGLERALIGRGVVAPGDVGVFVNVHVDLARGDTNYLRILRTSAR